MLNRQTVALLVHFIGHSCGSLITQTRDQRSCRLSRCKTRGQTVSRPSASSRADPRDKRDSQGFVGRYFRFTSGIRQVRRTGGTTGVLHEIRILRGMVADRIEFGICRSCRTEKRDCGFVHLYFEEQRREEC